MMGEVLFRGDWSPCFPFPAARNVVVWPRKPPQNLTNVGSFKIGCKTVVFRRCVMSSARSMATAPVSGRVGGVLSLVAASSGSKAKGREGNARAFWNVKWREDRGCMIVFSRMGKGDRWLITAPGLGGHFGMTGSMARLHISGTVLPCAHCVSSGTRSA